MDFIPIGARSFVTSTPLYFGLLTCQFIFCTSFYPLNDKPEPDSGNLSKNFSKELVEYTESEVALNASLNFSQSNTQIKKDPCNESITTSSLNLSEGKNSSEETITDTVQETLNENNFKSKRMNKSSGIQNDSDTLQMFPDTEKDKPSETRNLSLQSTPTSISHTLQRLSTENVKHKTEEGHDLETRQYNATRRSNSSISVGTPTLHERSFATFEEEDVVTSLFESNSSLDPQRESNSSELGRKVSSLLDSLLLGYDKRLRPNFGRTPLKVKADMEIRSMGPISEKDMIFSMDCYFRQNWVDRRLAFNATEEQVTKVSLNLKMLERIWHPDTYFINGGPSYVHTITTPNKFIRLFYDGSILFSQRLTIKATCPMHLEKFPMDSQLCPLHIASFGYPASDVIYEWHYGNALAAVASTDMRLSQFDLKGMPASNSTRSFKGSPHSILTVFFDFRRHTGFFLIQVYLPCCLLVILSWVSFWINREATSDRISLGATTMLTMTFLVLDSRNDLPRVAYSTALDVYVALCFFFVFASIVQFAAVHFFTKYGTADNDFKASVIHDTDSDSDSEDSGCDQGCFQSSNQKNFRQPNNSHINLKPDSLTACIRKMWSCLLSTRTKRFNKNVRNALGLNSVSKIDTMSRVLFPAAFLALNIVYWILYW